GLFPQIGGGGDVARHTCRVTLSFVEWQALDDKKPREIRDLLDKGGYFILGPLPVRVTGRPDGEENRGCSRSGEQLIGLRIRADGVPVEEDRQFVCTAQPLPECRVQCGHKLRYPSFVATLGKVIDMRVADEKIVFVTRSDCHL